MRATIEIDIAPPAGFSHITEQQVLAEVLRQIAAKAPRALPTSTPSVHQARYSIANVGAWSIRDSYDETFGPAPVELADLDEQLGRPLPADVKASLYALRDLLTGSARRRAV